MKKYKLDHFSFNGVHKLLIFMGCILFIIGCTKTEDQKIIKDLVYHYKLNDSNDVKNNVKMALSQIKNNKKDHKPVLIYAILMLGGKDNTRPLELLIYDEDADILGIGINENNINSNGIQTNLNEEYSVFTYRNFPQGTIFPLVPVHIRNSFQIKSEQKWKNYTAGKAIEMDKFRDKSNLWDYEYYKNTLPEVWVSLPKSKKTEVEVYVYDKAGNKSNSVKLRLFENIHVRVEEY